MSSANELQLLLIIQEALSNVRKHAQARRTKIRVAVHRGYVEARIQDDGIGFNPSAPLAVDRPHLGLVTIRERAEGVGGRFTLLTGPSQGTSITVRLPIAIA